MSRDTSRGWIRLRSSLEPRARVGIRDWKLRFPDAATDEKRYYLALDCRRLLSTRVPGKRREDGETNRKGYVCICVR